MKRLVVLICSVFTISSCVLFNEQSDEALHTVNAPEANLSASATSENATSFQQSFVDKDLIQADKLISAKRYEQALQLLYKVLDRQNSDYEAALMLTARAYDQTSQPEKAILALQELQKRNDKLIEPVRAYSLIYKNKIKISDYTKALIEKEKLDKLIYSPGADPVSFVDRLGWALDFSCDQYCVQEIKFLSAIQFYIIYLIERDPIMSNQAGQILLDRYHFFEQHVKQSNHSDSYKRKMALALIESVAFARSLQLLDPMGTKDSGFKRSAAIIKSLNSIELSMKEWLFE